MDQRSDAAPRPDDRGKRMYEPPEILTQEVFETTALACGKRPGQGKVCNLSKRS